MQPAIGTKLDLALVDTTGKSFPIEEGRATFLYFMRAPTCQQCNGAVRKLASQQEALRERGVDVVIALPTDTEEAAAWKSAKQVPFDVVTGQAGTAHEHAGLLLKAFGLVQQSGGILFDRQARVRYQHIATNPGDSLRMRELEAAIENLPATA